MELIKVIVEEMPTLKPTSNTIMVLLQQSAKDGVLGAIEAVCEHHPDLPVTCTILSESRTEAEDLLLPRTPPNTVNEAILLASVTRCSSPQNLQRLLQHNNKLRVDLDLLNACKNKSLIEN